MQLLYYARKLLIGARLLCPNCEQGRMFTGLFHMHETCPVCEARFERRSGESIGGTLLNLCFAEVLTIGGFIVSEILFHPPLAFQLMFWVAFNLLFVIFFYRHARGMWVSVAYLAGSVYPDMDEKQRAKQ